MAERANDEIRNIYALPFARAVTVFFAALVVTHIVLLSGTDQYIMVAASSGGIIAGLVLHWTHRQSGRVPSLGTCLMSFTIAINILAHLSIDDRPDLSTNVLLYVFGAGVFIRPLWIYLSSLSFILIGYCIVEQPWTYSENLSAHYGFGLAITTIIGWVAWRAKNKEHRRLRKLLEDQGTYASDLESTTIELEHALEEVLDLHSMSDDLASALTDFSLWIGSDGRVTKWRKPDAFDLLFQWFEVRPTTFRDVIDRLAQGGLTESKQQQIWSHYAGLKDDRSARTLEIYVQEQGRRFYYELRMFLLANDVTLVVLRDISEIIAAQEASVREDEALRRQQLLEHEVIERKKVEAALQQSVSLLSTTHQAMDDGLIVHNLVGEVQLINESMRTILGLTEYLDHSKLSESVNNALLALVDDHVDVAGRLLMGHDSDDFIAHTVDGRILAVSCRAQVIDDETLGRVCVIRDVTKQENSLQALQRSESNLAAVFESSNQAILLVSWDGTILETNSLTVNYTSLYIGSKLEVGDNFLDIFDEPDVLRWFERARSGENVELSTEYRGSYFDINFLPVKDENLVRAITITVQNTDDRAQTMQRIYESEESLRLAMEASDLAIWDMDIAQGKLNWQSNGTKAMGEWLELSSTGLDFAIEALVVADQTLVTQQFHLAATRGGTVDIEFRFESSTDLAWLHVRGEGLLDERGNVYRVLGVLEDITDRKQVETGLVTARKRAEEANNLKTSILANLSHEIRTPMTSILGFSELLVRKLEPPLQGQAESINRGGKRLLLLVDSLMDLARLEAKKLDLRIENISVNKVLDSVAVVMKPLAVDRGLEWDFDSTATIDSNVAVDQRRLEQVVGMVVENAIRFTDSGKIEITSHQIGTGNDLKVAITIRDQGVGMDGNFVRTALEPFAQESTGLARSHEGSGIGLPLAAGLVELMGGRLLLETTKGVGTLVTIIVPLANEATPSEFIRSVVSKEPVAEQSTRSILYVQAAESAPSALAIASRDIRSMKLEEAKTLSDGQYSDVIVGVGRMDEKSSYDLLVTLRGNPILYTSRCIAYCSEDTHASIESFRQAGYDEIVQQPADWSRFFGG